MPKFMINGSYSTEGIKGVLKEGGSGRVAAIEQLASAVGGSVETAYFAFGGSDIYVIVDLPDNASAAAIAATVGAVGCPEQLRDGSAADSGRDRRSRQEVDQLPTSGKLSASLKSGASAGCAKPRCAPWLQASH